mgnify:CR=1 FL=1
MKHRLLILGTLASLYSLLKNQKNGDIIRSSVMVTQMDRQDSMQMHLT